MGSEREIGDSASPRHTARMQLPSADSWVSLAELGGAEGQSPDGTPSALLLSADGPLAPKAAADLASQRSGSEFAWCSQADAHQPKQHLVEDAGMWLHSEDARTAAASSSKHSASTYFGLCSEADVHQQQDDAVHADQCFRLEEALRDSVALPIPESDIDTTVVPADLFDELLRAGEQTRQRGQHCLKETSEGAFILTTWAAAEPAAVREPKESTGRSPSSMCGTPGAGAPRSNVNLLSLKAVSPTWLEAASWDFALPMPMRTSASPRWARGLMPPPLPQAAVQKGTAKAVSRPPGGRGARSAVFHPGPAGHEFDIID